MLQLFPELLSYQFFAPFFIRVALGLLFATVGGAYLIKDRATYEEVLAPSAGARARGFVTALGCYELLLGGLLLAGYLVQIAAVLVIVDAVLYSYLSAKKHRFAALTPYDATVNALAFAMALSLLVSGPGPFSLDLPL